jgi:hypothetical protein
LESTDLFFDGFVAGLITPHDNGLAVTLVERFEDLVSIIFIPLVRHVFHLIVKVTRARRTVIIGG